MRGHVLQALSVALKTFVQPVQQQLAALQGSAEVTLRALTSSLEATTACCTQLATQFPDTEARVLASLTHPLLQPYEGFIGDYVRLEAVVLSQEVRHSAASAPALARWARPCTVMIDVHDVTIRCVEGHSLRAHARTRPCSCVSNWWLRARSSAASRWRAHRRAARARQRRRPRW